MVMTWSIIGDLINEWICLSRDRKVYGCETNEINEDEECSNDGQSFKNMREASTSPCGSGHPVMYVINTAIFECCRRRIYVREQRRRYKLQSERILPIYTLSCGSLLYRSISKSRTGYGFVHMRQIFRKF